MHVLTNFQSFLYWRRRCYGNFNPGSSEEEGAIVTLILGQVELVQVCNIVYKIWNLWSKGVFWEKDLLCFSQS